MHELGVQNSTKRCLEKLGRNLESLQLKKEQIHSYRDLLEKKESNVDDVLHLIYVKRNPEDHGARIFDTRTAIIKMGERLTFVDSLIEMHVAFIDTVKNDRVDIVLYHAVVSLSSYLGAISDQDNFWKVTGGSPGYQLVSMLSGYSTSLSKAAHAIKCVMEYKKQEE
jgi:hypothetical protein